jgi:hypothetical protein
MERAKVVKDEIVEQNSRFLAVYVEAKNSCLILLSEQEDRLGTLAIVSSSWGPLHDNRPHVRGVRGRSERENRTRIRVR